MFCRYGDKISRESTKGCQNRQRESAEVIGRGSGHANEQFDMVINLESDK